MTALVTGLNPKRWAVKVSIDSASEGVCHVLFEVNTAGHPFISDAERTFWERELSAAGSVLRGESIPDLSEDVRKVTSSSVRMVLYTLSCSVAFAFGVGLLQVLARRYGVDTPGSLTGVGAGIGVAVGMHMSRRARS